MITQAVNILSNYFLNPYGLIALAGIIPLILIYMFRKKPREQLMPSIRFFVDDRDQGIVKRSMRKIIRNLILLLHLLVIIGLAATIANPYILSEGEPKRAVIIIDNSASMNGELSNVKNKIKKELGNKNTLIIANDEPKIVSTNVGPSKIREKLEEISVQHTKT
ncbi:MAG: BatA domain-containing protein, partial [Candidatus Nanohaloarchaea archaeon]